MELEYSIDAQNYILKETKEGLRINDKLIEHEIRRITNNHVVIRAFNETYDIELLKRAKNSLRLKINGKVKDVELHDPLAQLLQKMGMNNSSHSAVTELLAPMPGTILDVKTKKGDAVKKGDPLIVLVAMKMENMIKSPTNGVIETIEIEINQNVEKNQVLLRFA